MKELIERLRYPVICTLDDRLEAADALERLTAELEATKKAVQQNYFRVVEVTAERDSLSLDAKRYRWLRSVGAGVWPRLGTRCRVVAEGDSLDEYVDMGIEGKSV